MTTPVRERSPEVLRRQAGEGDDEARSELRRRRSNLRGAVIPEWERAERGEKVDDWDLW
ncbi:MAG TPA: hypothetical protein VF009_07030 [Solirubrobacterales bacterium]